VDYPPSLGAEITLANSLEENTLEKLDHFQPLSRWFAVGCADLRKD
jgi:hypothetical protein